ncbi:MAG: shikimate dehydrogenase, partial [Candidatus Omnitrophota bacterium]|nr:shikimate dehydrogenase [Candidatus Omnitrophota bacterium]
MAHKTYGIIGHPVSHSLSPAMQNAAFKECGLDAEYLL